MRRDGGAGRAWTRGGKLPAHEAPRLDTLDACREAWEARNPEGLWWGIVHCSASGGLPRWLAAALLTMLKLRPVQRRFWEPFRRRLVDFARFGAVRAARQRGLTWESAYKAAAQDLERTPAFGSAAAMAKSYKRVSRLFGAAPGRYALGPIAPKE